MPKRRYELGLILLLVQIINLGADAIPPVTLSLVCIQAILYMNFICKPWTTLGMYATLFHLKSSHICVNHEYDVTTYSNSKLFT